MASRVFSVILIHPSPSIVLSVFVFFFECVPTNTKLNNRGLVLCCESVYFFVVSVSCTNPGGRVENSADGFVFICLERFLHVLKPHVL